MSVITIYPCQQLLAQKSAVDTVAYLPDDAVQRLSDLSVYVVFPKGCTGGSVVVETAHQSSYQGAWVNEGTIDFAQDHAVKVGRLKGCHAAVRVRILREIRGGSVDVWAIAVA